MKKIDWNSTTSAQGKRQTTVTEKKVCFQTFLDSEMLKFMVENNQVGSAAALTMPHQAINFFQHPLHSGKMDRKKK